ncbi:polysaccharide pyruvyl transferase family protein [Candidatus Saccharibacteria bacterium TM7i]|nr:polysaccharide pyruvyl transferase family protein [Candidatus Saccharibacteria bacterium TM7i]
MRKKTLAIRFYNAENLGDDLFLYIAAERYKNVNIITNGAQVPADISGKSVRVLTPIKSVVLRGLDKLFHTNLALKSITKKVDAFAYIGGSILIEGEDIKRWYSERALFTSSKAPAFILGSNIGPYSSADFLSIVEDIFKASADVCLRDANSYALVSGLDNVRLSTDIAFSLNTEAYAAISSTKNVIVSIIDSYKKFGTDVARKYDRAIASLTKKLTEEGYRVTYMSFCKYEGDEKACERIASLLPREIREKVQLFNYRGNLQESLQLLASSELIIGSRFHANILGLVFGKKVLPMAYSDKTINILKDMNFPGQIIDIRKIDSFDVDTVDFDSIPIVDVSAQKKLAETQFQELDKVLTRA